MDFGPNSAIWAYVFWINVIICAALAIVALQNERKYFALVKRLKSDLKLPGMKNIRWLFRYLLKRHGINTETEMEEKTKKHTGQDLN